MTPAGREPGGSDRGRRAGDGRRQGRRRGQAATPSGTEPPRKAATRLWAGLALVVGVHVVLALSTSVPQMHHGGDNTHYLSLAHSLVQDGTYRDIWTPGEPEHSKYPPLYPAFLAAMMLAGAKTWSAFKASSLAFTTLATAFCFLWARRLRGDRTALATALVFGASYSLLSASHWILSEPFFVATTMGSLWLLASAQGRKDARPSQPPLASPPPTPRLRLAAGLVLAGAAYFIRSAGLPLIVAAAAWLAIGKRWKELGAFAAVLAAPALLWQSRAGEQYTSEFWLKSVYAPELGRVGPWDFVVRVATNAWDYATEHVPIAVAGDLGGATIALGIGLAVAATVGWLRRVRSGPGVAEGFAFLHVGLMLAWPPAGASERFALPVLPLALFWGCESVARLAAACAARWGTPGRRPDAARHDGLRWRRWAGAAALAAVVAVPAGLSWSGLREVSRICREAVSATGPLGCWGSNIRNFHFMALWAGDHLPEGSTVFARKPRIFYAFSGLPSATFPFETSPARFFGLADSLGIDYIVRDAWGVQAARFVDPVVAAHPERFCTVAGFRLGAESISLLAILPPPGDEAAEGPDPAGSTLSECAPLGAGASTMPSQAAVVSMTVPFLTDRSPSTRPRPDLPG